MQIITIDIYKYVVVHGFWCKMKCLVVPIAVP